MALYSKNTKKDILITGEDGEQYRIIICRFVKKKFSFEKVTDQCLLTSIYKGQIIGHVIYNLHRNRVILFSLISRILVIMIANNFFLKKTVDKKKIR